MWLDVDRNGSITYEFVIHHYKPRMEEEETKRDSSKVRRRGSAAFAMAAKPSHDYIRGKWRGAAAVATNLDDRGEQRSRNGKVRFAGDGCNLAAGRSAGASASQVASRAPRSQAGSRAMLQRDAVELGC